MDASPLRSFRNPELACPIRIEASLSLSFDDAIAERQPRAVLDLEWDNRVILPLHRLAGIQLVHLEWEGQPVNAELLGAFEMPRSAFRSPESQDVLPPLKRHGPHQSNHADHVIGMKVCEEDV